jgi:hypothetical protein
MIRYVLQSLFYCCSIENRKKKIMMMISPKYNQVARGIRLMPVHEGIWGERGLEVKLEIILVRRALVSSTHRPLFTQKNNFRSSPNGRLRGLRAGL